MAKNVHHALVAGTGLLLVKQMNCIDNKRIASTFSKNILPCQCLDSAQQMISSCLPEGCIISPMKFFFSIL